MCLWLGKWSITKWRMLVADWLMLDAFGFVWLPHVAPFCRDMSLNFMRFP